MPKIDLLSSAANFQRIDTHPSEPRRRNLKWQWVGVVVSILSPLQGCREAPWNSLNEGSSSALSTVIIDYLADMAPAPPFDLPLRERGGALPRAEALTFIKDTMYLRSGAMLPEREGVDTLDEVMQPPPSSPETPQDTPPTWDITTEVALSPLPTVFQERLASQPAWVVHIPNTGTLVDFSRLTDLQKQGETAYHITDMRLNPDPRTAHLLVVYREIILTLMQADRDKTVQVLTPEGTLQTLVIDPTALPYVVVEMRDLDDFGADMARYAGNVDLKDVTQTITADFRQVRLLDADGHLLVRLYQSDRAALFSNEQSSLMTQAVAFAYADGDGFAKLDTTGLRFRVREGFSSFLSSTAELKFLGILE